MKKKLWLVFLIGVPVIVLLTISCSKSIRSHIFGGESGTWTNPGPQTQPTERQP